MKNYFGRMVAIDASMSLYQFLVAVRSQGEQLTNENGDTTSHIQGFFFRTIRMLENGVKPVYVFDGKAPELKSGELVKRREALAKAQQDLAVAQEQGNEENVDKYKRRTVRVNKDHVADVKELLECMGLPYIDAPGEAEAQCAKLVKDDLVFGVATEDMDALTFGACIQLRKFSAPASQKLAVVEYNLKKVLEGFEMTMEQFIDTCILLGCDYTDRITGIGPKKVMDLMKKHGTIEKILENIDSKKFPVDPEKFLYKEARVLFDKPDVKDVSESDLKFEKVDEERLIKFLCEKHSFSEQSVKNGAARIVKSKSKGSQKRVDDFFKFTPKEGGAKRKLSTAAKGKDAKKAKAGKGRGRPRK